MAQYRSPSPLDFFEPKWDQWRSQFITFRLVTELNKKDEEVQVASLKYCMGPEADDIFKTFGLSEENQKIFDVVLKKFDEYFKPKVNIIRMRRIFQRRIQQTHENEDTYLRALYAAAEDCNFGDLKKEKIRDQFIGGLLDEKLSEKLEHLYMSEPKIFTLELVTEYARTYCDIWIGRQKEREAMKQKHIDEVKGRQKHVDEVKNKPRSSPADRKQPHVYSCGYCGESHGRGSCPAYGKICKQCGRKNHYAKVCRSARRTRYIREVTESHERQEPATEEDEYFLGECIGSNGDKWNVDIEIDNKYIKFKVDTGADVTILNYSSYMKSLAKCVIHPRAIKLYQLQPVN